MNKAQLMLIEDTFGYSSDEAINARKQMKRHRKNQKNSIKVIYIRLDGILFIQLYENDLTKAKHSWKPGSNIILQVSGAYQITGILNNFSETGIFLKDWEIERW